MTNAGRKSADRAPIGVILALAAVLLASSYGGASPDSPVVLDAGSLAPCGVAAEVGTAVAADAGNAGVTCSEGFHTVDGAISGLTRAGLVLADGTHVVPVPANTTSFTLPAPVAGTDGYAVSVAAQPAGLTCSVSNGSGSMPPGNVTSVKVKCLDSAEVVARTATNLNVRQRLMLFLALARSSRSPRL